jgi:ABC-2 type transport system ATP-binding protein
VFVSSHILSEVAQTCDHVAILSRGKCVATGAVADVLASRSVGLLVRVDDPARAIQVLASVGIQASASGDSLKVDVAAEEGARVTQALAVAGLYLSELRPVEVDLETVFLELTKDPATEANPQ